MAKGDIRVVGTLSGNSPETRFAVPKAASTFRQGEWVRLTTTDTLTVMEDAGTSGCVGAAAEDAVVETPYPNAGTLKTQVKYWALNLDTIFSVKIVTGTFVAGETLGQFDAVIAAGVHGVNPDVTTQREVRVIGLDPFDSTRMLVVGCGISDAASTGSQHLGNPITRQA